MSACGRGVPPDFFAQYAAAGRRNGTQRVWIMPLAGREAEASTSACPAAVSMLAFQESSPLGPAVTAMPCHGHQIGTVPGLPLLLHRPCLRDYVQSPATRLVILLLEVSLRRSCSQSHPVCDSGAAGHRPDAIAGAARTNGLLWTRRPGAAAGSGCGPWAALYVTQVGDSTSSYGSTCF